MNYNFNEILVEITKQIKNFLPYDFMEKVIISLAAITIVFGISRLLEKED